MGAQTASADIIKTLPQTAERGSYVFSGFTYTTFWGKTMPMDENMLPAELAFDGNTVYWKDPTLGGYDAYIKGEKAGDKITFEFPQQVTSSLYLNRMYNTSTVETSVSYAVAEQAQNKVEFTVLADGTILMEDFDPEDTGLEPNGEIIIGVSTSTGAWKSLGCFGVKLTPFTDHLVEAPANLELKQLVMSYNGGACELKGGWDGNDLYIQGLCEALPAVWLKGTLSDGKVRFPSGQWVGIDPTLGWLLFMYGNHQELEWSDSAGEYIANLFDDDFVLAYDSEGFVLTAENNLQFCPGSDYKGLPAYAPVKGIVIREKKEITDFTPAKPVITAVGLYGYDPSWGYDYIDVTLSDVTVDGQMLDQNNLYYRVLLDGEPYILDPDDFEGLTGPTEWIPFNFTCYDLEDIGGTGRSVSIYAEPAAVYAVQEKYVDGDKEYLSDIVGWDVDGIAALLGDRAAIADEFYTDLSGRRVAEPRKGLYIKTVVFENGRRVNRKVVKK